MVSGNPFSKSGDLLKELGTSIHHPFCKLIIAHLIGHCPEFFQSYAVTQVTLSPGHRFQPFIGCHHLLIGISLLDFTSGVNNRDREETRAMEVDIRIKEVSIKPIYQFSAHLWDISMSQLLTNHGAVLGLHQSIIIGMSGP